MQLLLVISSLLALILLSYSSVHEITGPFRFLLRAGPSSTELWWVIWWIVPLFSLALISLWRSPKSYPIALTKRWIARFHFAWISEWSWMHLITLTVIIGLNLCWTLIPIWYFMHEISPKNYWFRVFKFTGNQLGWAAIWCMAFTLLLTLRRLQIFSMLQINYFRGLPFHRIFGWLSLFYVSAHSIIWGSIYISRGVFWERVFPYTTTGWVNFFGLVGWAALGILSLFSLEYFRRERYRIFIRLHQLYILFILGTITHISRTVMFLLPAILLFLVDRFSSWSIFKNTEFRASIQRFPNSDVFRLTVWNARRDNMPAYEVGDYVRISSPAIRWIESHPFSIYSNWDETPDRLVLVIKAMGGWTDELMQLSHMESIPVSLNGYFQVSHPSRNKALNCTNIVMVAGGVGVVPLIPEIKELVLHSEKQHITLFLVVRHLESLLAFSDFLAFVKKYEHRIFLKLFVTRPYEGKISLEQTVHSNDPDETKSFLGDDEIFEGATATTPLLSSSPQKRKLCRRIVFCCALAGLCAGTLGFFIGRYIRFHSHHTEDCRNYGDRFFRMMQCRIGYCVVPLLLACVFASFACWLASWLMTLHRYGVDEQKTTHNVIELVDLDNFEYIHERIDVKKELKSLVDEGKIDTSQKVPILCAGPESLVKSTYSAIGDLSDFFDFYRESVVV